MLITKLLNNVEVLSVSGSLDIDISSIKINSESVKLNDMFVCLNGVNHKGDDYVGFAIKNGAKCIVSELDCYVKSVTFIKVKNARKAFSLMCKNFYECVADKLKYIFVVGTNGKSTTSYLIHEIFKKNNIKSALVGTMYIEYDNIKLDSHLTTPDPDELHKLLSQFYKNNVEWVVMEVSAHAIDLYKTYGINANIKIFTNFSQDHLDYFNSMSEYKECKKSFFMEKSNEIDIVNVDDKLGIEIFNSSKNKIVTFGLENPADVFAINVNQDKNKCTFILNLFDNIFSVSTNLFGLFNVYNNIAAIIACYIAKIDGHKIIKAVNEISPPKGRFNIFHINSVKYIVDFAHTPDGLYNLIKEAKKITKNRLITIFGCGGDRDVLKRPIMGKIASSMSDVTIITTDNPRCEDMLEIIEDICQGVVDKDKVEIVVDRKKAILYASQIAKDGDVVLIAGKGSEDYIDVNGIKVPYSDLDEVKKLGAKS